MVFFSVVPIMLPDGIGASFWATLTLSGKKELSIFLDEKKNIRFIVSTCRVKLLLVFLCVFHLQLLEDLL